MNENENLKLLSKSAAATKLGIGRTTLTKLINLGTIRVTAINGNVKISVKELIRFLDKNTFPLSELDTITKKLPVYRLKQSSPQDKTRLQLTSKISANNIFNHLKTEVLNGIGV
ncbi:MAG: helix-turn-helix domain-containing protein [Bacteroidetes bacterium]|nr:helix-turn-helix domain-containing protein [Bacteroidota bacterium]